MKKNDTVPNNTNYFELTIEEIREFYYQAINSRGFGSGAEKIRIDSKWTSLFQRLNGHGNSNVLSGFKLRLEMDEENGQEEILHK
jgi:hypothetical protein